MFPGLKKAFRRALGAVGFSYDAINPRGRRRNPGSKVPREDAFAKGSKRRALQANAADLCRNLSLAAWMVRRHLDYVTQFRFHSRTGIDELDQQIEKLMDEDARPERADIAGKFGREKIFRLAEMRRVLDGDVFLVKYSDGRLQGIQGDLVQDPQEKEENEEWIDGVLVTQVGRALSYSFRVRKGYDQDKPDRRVDSTNVIHYGHFERFAADQVRGVSPLAAALNPLRDVYENFDYALAKSKVSQLFALAIYRDAVEGFGADEDDEDQADPPATANGGQSATTEPQPRYDVKFDKGPVLLDLEEGDRAEFLESKTPSSEFQSFTTLVIQVALKALDIPYSFYDESHTNFFGSRAAWLHYERSCRDKRDDQLEMRRNYTIWKLRQWIRDGRLVLPAGMTINDLNWEWQPRGMPWWDPAKEVSGTIAAIGAGLDTPQRACKAADTDFFENIDEIAKAQEYARKKGVILDFSKPSKQPQAKATRKGANNGNQA